MIDELLSAKELAVALKRSTAFVYRMRSRGFVMPGGTATIGEARAWLTAHPVPLFRRNPVERKKSQKP
jgi:hypothetical protein